MRLSTITGWDQVASLFLHEKRLLVRFVGSAVGRAAASTLVVLVVIQRFLSGALGGGARAGIVGRLAAHLGPGAAIIVLGFVLFSCQVAASLCNYANTVAQLQNRQGRGARYARAPHPAPPRALGPLLRSPEPR